MPDWHDLQVETGLIKNGELGLEIEPNRYTTTQIGTEIGLNTKNLVDCSRIQGKNSS